MRAEDAPRRRTVTRTRLQLLEQVAKPINVGATAGEELAAEANVQAAAADDVGHERVAGHEPAAGSASASARTSIRLRLGAAGVGGAARGGISARSRSNRTCEYQQLRAQLRINTQLGPRPGDA